jgi:triacylglycerol lipase
MSAAQFEAAEQIRKLGREILPAIPGSQAIYADRHEREPYAGVQVTRDAQYGSHERNRLDVFNAEGGPDRKPVFVFVHGGGFVGGDKKHPGSPYLDNIGLWAARAGLLGVNITYRLAPDHMFPAGSEDLGSAVRWLRANADSIGADPDRIFLMGTSAGAAHVAGFIAHDRFAADRAGVAGAIMLSGIYDLRSIQSDGMAQSYYGADPAKWEAMSPMPGLIESPIPLLFVLTQHDPQPFERQALQLIEAWVARHGHWPNFVRLLGHNHLTSTFHLNTDDRVLGDQMLQFMQACPSAKAQLAAPSAAAMAG